MKKIKHTFGILALLIIVIYCSSPNEPWGKNPRDYTWSVDTVINPDPYDEQTLMSSIWGSSPNDVYICGHTSGGPNIYHYDGENWTAIDLRDYGLRNGYRNKVFGFAENDVWIAGGLGHSAEGGYATSELIHYNGDVWRSYEFETRGELEDVWGTSKSDLWACGENGIIIHRVGADNWEIDTIKASVEGVQQFIVRHIRKVDDKLYAIGYKSERPQSLFYVKDGNEWITQDSFYVDEETAKWGIAQLFCTSDNRIFSTGRGGLFEYCNSRWENIFQLTSGFYGINECVERQYLLAGIYGKIYMYSNDEFELISEFSTNTILKELWGNTEECFILATTGWRTYVFHGK